MMMIEDEIDVKEGRKDNENGKTSRPTFLTRFSHFKWVLLPTHSEGKPMVL